MFILISAVIFLYRILGVGTYLNLESVKTHKDLLAAFVAAHYGASAALYIILYFIMVLFSVPGAVWLTLVGGYLFGWYLAPVYINIGATAGAAVLFLGVRYAFGIQVQQRYGAKLISFNEEMDQNGVWYLLTVRLIPAFPFFMINLLAGLTRVPLTTFIWTTAVGIIPGSFIYAWAGSSLETVSSAKDLVSWRILLALFLLGLFTAVPVIVRKTAVRIKKH